MEAYLLTTERKQLESQIRDCLRWADDIFFLVAFARYNAFELFREDIVSFLRRGGRLRVVFDIERFFTEPQIIEELATIPGNSQCRVFYRSEKVVNEKCKRLLHSKIYLFRKSSALKVIIGSSNLTVSGITHNLEANVFLEGVSRDRVLRSTKEEVEAIWASPCAIKPENHYAIIEQYERFFNEQGGDTPLVQRLQATHRNELDSLFQAAIEAMQVIPNADIAYLLGLIAAGGTLVHDRLLEIIYHKGVFNRGTENEGIILADGITSFRMDQAKAFRKDVNGIRDSLNEYFDRIDSGDRASVQKVSDYDYKIRIRFNGSSAVLCAVNDYLSSLQITRRGVVPIIPDLIADTVDRNVIMSFVRGYADVRSRISPTDRTGGTGHLRIALSFSTGADEFATKIKEILETEFGIERINLLIGGARGRETMLRIDPVYLDRLQPLKIFPINWKQILLHDFAIYNLKHFPTNYYTPDETG